MLTDDATADELVSVLVPVIWKQYWVAAVKSAVPAFVASRSQVTVWPLTLEAAVVPDVIPGQAVAPEGRSLVSSFQLADVALTLKSVAAPEAVGKVITT